MPEIADGETALVQGSAAKPYELKNTGGVYSCSCPAWRNQSTPIERRTCKHLRKYRGEAEEKERLGGELPAKAKPSGAKEDAPPLLLAHSWDSATDLTDWWISEKLDGVRAYWDGKRFFSRLGNEYFAPDWFVEGFPKCPLDGELWIDRKAFQKTVSIVRRQDKSEHWKDVRFVVFDAPGRKSKFEKRMEFLKEALPAESHAYVQLLEHYRCEGTDHLREELARIEALGGEGLMLRQPGSKYEVGRSHTLLKVKSFHDAEATVVAHVGGKGKHKGRMGALSVQLADGTEFNVGTGFTDKERENPPEIGSVITFRYQELSDGGVPRFPSFFRAAPRNAKASDLADTKGTKAKKKATKKKATKRKSPKKKAKKKPAAKAGKEPAAKSDSSAAGKRYFELVNDKSSKFWEVSVADSTVTVRYGRIGTDGTTKPKDFATPEAATAHADKLIDQKTAKGYAEASG